MKVSATLLVFSLGIFAVLASPIENQGKRLIKTSEQDPGTWMTKEETFQLRLNRVGFVDITDNRDFSLENKVINTAAIPTVPRFQIVVSELLRVANRTRVESFLRDFTSFVNRHSNSSYGEDSQRWLLTQVQSSLAGYRGSSFVRDIEHPAWRQNSIVARIEGVDPELKNEIVILGAHLDSIAGDEMTPAPGADDNASGSAVVIEVLRVLVVAGIRPRRTIEFHWYAAEEQGLQGSSVIAKEYKDNNVIVAGMLNLDVVAWPGTTNQKVIGVFTDNASDDVVQFNRVLTDAYLDYTWGNRSCGYGCSDHASWTSNGYPAAFVAEFEPNPNGHRATDTFETVGFEQVMEFVKLATAFAVEIGELPA